MSDYNTYKHLGLSSNDALSLHHHNQDMEAKRHERQRISRLIPKGYGSASSTYDGSVSGSFNLFGSSASSKQDVDFSSQFWAMSAFWDDVVEAVLDTRAGQIFFVVFLLMSAFLGLGTYWFETASVAFWPALGSFIAGAFIPALLYFLLRLLTSLIAMALSFAILGLVLYGLFKVGSVVFGA